MPYGAMLYGGVVANEYGFSPPSRCWAGTQLNASAGPASNGNITRETTTATTSAAKIALPLLTDNENASSGKSPAVSFLINNAFKLQELGATCQRCPKTINCYQLIVFRVFRSSEFLVFLTMQAKDFSDLYELEESLWWFRGMRSITRALLDHQLRNAVPRKVLDSGCGAGGNLKFLEQYSSGEKVVGLDVTTEAIHFCRLNGADLTVQASATDLPFSCSHFDMVTSFDVLVQIPGEGSDTRALAEMFRVLRPGGIVFVRVAAYKWMRAGHDVAMGTQRRYDLDDLRQAVENVGFEITRSTYANGVLFPIAMLKRMVLEPLRLANAGSDVRRFPTGLGWLDPVFRAAMSLEAIFFRGTRRSLPYGLSAICIARKPGPEITDARILK